MGSGAIPMSFFQARAFEFEPELALALLAFEK